MFRKGAEGVKKGMDIFATGVQRVKKGVEVVAKGVERVEYRSQRLYSAINRQDRIVEGSRHREKRREGWISDSAV